VFGLQREYEGFMNLPTISSAGRFDLGFETASSRLILGAVIVSFGAHLALFLLYAAPSDLEAEYITPAEAWTFYSALVSGWGVVFGPSLFAARALSAISALAALILVARLALRWSGDQTTGAALPLGLILFPPTAYIFAQATPHALAALLTVAAISVVTSKPGPRPAVAMAKAGLLCALLAALHKTGIGLCAAVIVMALVQMGIGRTSLTLISVTAAGLLVVWFLFPISPADLPFDNQLSMTFEATLTSEVIRPYAMIWVALSFSVIALIGSKALRALLDQNGVRRSTVLMMVFALALSWMILSPDISPGERLTAFNTILVLGLLAAMPMVMWIRLVMPHIRSIFVWILLPVIMYSCFWVVLSPIDPQGFPYSRLLSESILMSAQPPG
jgi:hypothetical protein